MKFSKAAVFFLSALFLLPGMELYSYDMKDVIAAPVPFNPSEGAVAFLNLPAFDEFTIDVFDVNGDTVARRSYSSPGNVRWNGRNTRGNVVKPGLYIIKVTARDSATDSYGKKTIRVLVRY